MRLFKGFLLLIIVALMSGCSGKIEKTTIASLEELVSIGDIIEATKVDLSSEYDDYAVAYKIRYKSDDCEVIGYIAAPPDYMEKEYPIVIYNRGGNREFGKLNDYTIASLATGDYIALGSQYRGVDGGTGTEEFGGKDINDVIKLIDISESFSFAQKGGVYMAGSSRGGMMTYIAARKDDRIKAAVVFAGVSDLAANYRDRGSDMKRVHDELIGGSPDEFPEEYEKRSAVNWADELDAPFLIIHGGDKDWRVLTKQSRDMADELEKANKEHKLIIYEEADHGLSGTDYIMDMVKWFDSHPI